MDHASRTLLPLALLLACSEPPPAATCGALGCEPTQFDADAKQVLPPTFIASGGALYWADGVRGIYRLDLDDESTKLGELPEDPDLDEYGNSATSLVILGDTAYLGIGTSAGVYAVPIAGGEVTEAFADRYVFQVAAYGDLLVWGTASGPISIGDPADGSFEQLAEVSQLASHTAVSGDYVYVHSVDGQTRIDMRTREIKTEDIDVFAVPLATSPTGVYWDSFDGIYHRLNSEDGAAKLIIPRADAQVRTINVYTGTNEGLLYAEGKAIKHYILASGKSEVLQTQDIGAIVALTSDDQGYYWVNEFGGVYGVGWPDTAPADAP